MSTGDAAVGHYQMALAYVVYNFPVIIGLQEGAVNNQCQNFNKTKQNISATGFGFQLLHCGVGRAYAQIQVQKSLNLL